MDVSLIIQNSPKKRINTYHQTHRKSQRTLDIYKSKLFIEELPDQQSTENTHKNQKNTL